MKSEHFIYLRSSIKVARVVLHIARTVAFVGIGYAWQFQKNDLNSVIVGFLFSLFFWFFWRKTHNDFINGELVHIPRIGKIGQTEPFIIVVITLTLMNVWEVMCLWYSIKMAFW